jgi:hypothetical protein
MSRKNNLKHGYYCKPPVFPESAAFKALMKSLRRESNGSAKAAVGPPVVDQD